MTNMWPSHNQALLWIICLVWMTTNGEGCPRGARIHLPSLRCFWLSDTTLSWFEARETCRESHGADLASAQSLELQHFISNSFPLKTTEWVWLQGLEQRGPEDGVGVPQSPVWVDKDSESQNMCRQVALGTVGRWRMTQCGGRHLYLCEEKVTDSLPSIDSYLTGLVLITGFYANTQIHPLLSVPDIGQQTVEVQLFPGLWFSHAGQLASVELVVQPSPVSSLARVQILRPYCKSNHHLVPPGCSSLLNPFSCCSAVPLCNTTGGCSAGQYWCHLLEACVPTTSPCSPYDPKVGARGFALPPRYIALPPFYHLAADLPLRVKPNSELRTLSVVVPDQAVMVYPDDIVAVQHTLDSGTFLHCLKSEASLNSAWRQSYVSIRGMEKGGWLEGGLTQLPQEHEWVDGVVCDLKMLYVDTLHRATDHEDIVDYARTDTTTTSDFRRSTAGSGPSLRSKFRLGIIYPLPDEKNRIHIQTDVPTLIVVKALFGEKARSSWSAPILQAGIPFLPTCPEGLDQSSPGCRSHDTWFSSVTFVLPSLGVQILNVSVMDAKGFQSVTVEVCGYEAVTGLSVQPRGCLRMLVDTSQLFSARVERGSTVKFTWVIDDLHEFAHEGESYSVMFKKRAEYTLQVTASNPISSVSQQIHLSADEAAPFTLPEFQFLQEVIAMNATYVYTIRVKADISLPVTFRWDFGDDSPNVVHTQSAPCSTMSQLNRTRDERVYVQDSVNVTYSTPEDYRLHVQVSNQYDNTEASMGINVRPQLHSLHISPSTSMPVVKQPLHLEASVVPSDFSVSYIWDFGDGSQSARGSHSKTSHSFESAGVYNVTVRANNTLTSLTAWLLLVAVEKISGLTVAYSGPLEAGSATELRAEVESGTDLVWDFDLGDGSLRENLTAGSITHIYEFPGNYRVDVTVSNSVSEAHQSITLDIYSLTISGLLPTECVKSGQDIQLTALVNGNSTILTFHWVFGDDTPTVVVRGEQTVTHTFPKYGFFPVNLTVHSSIASTSFSSSLCVQSPISSLVVQLSKDAVAVGDEICVTVLVSPVQTSGYQFKWVSVSSGLVATTENSEKCFVFRDEGIEEVSVTARNKVSNKTAKATINIQKPVGTFSIAHDRRSVTLTTNMSVSFWAVSCVGSNVSVIWDFGDHSPLEQRQNVSHVFETTGQFLVTATAFNHVSRSSATLEVDVVPPVSDLWLHTSRPYAVVGEETLITAVSSDVSTTGYYWTVVGVNSCQPGDNHFRFVFPKPGVFRVKVNAQNLVGEREAAISIEVFERIQGLQIKSQSLTNTKHIPTHEMIQFTTSVTKGSNVTYHWLATQRERQLTGDGEMFSLMAETPGVVSVQLQACNVLGQATSSVLLVAVERITSAHITTPSSSVALGKVVNITVVVDTGTNVQYFWYVNAVNPSPVQTERPFLLHTFTNVGECLVGVSVQNVISQSNDSKLFSIQEEIQNVGFRIENQKDPFYVNTRVELAFHGIVYKGSNLHWEWRLQTAEQNLFTSTNQTCTCTFLHAGVYEVHLKASNDVSCQVVSHSVTVQDAIKDLVLNISKSSLCAGEQVTFVPSITRGTNVSFVITFQNEDWTDSGDISDGQFTSSSVPPGKHQVTVKAFNHVSSAEASSIVLVTERILGLRLVNCCSTTLEGLKGRRFKAEVESGSPVNYTWMFHSEGSAPVHLFGEEVIFTPPENGLLTVTVIVANGACSQTRNATVMVERPVKEVQLLCQAERIFAGHAVWFSAATAESRNFQYLWDFGDSTQALLTNISHLSHTYYHTGKFAAVVQVFNNVSQVSTQRLVEVEALQCFTPRASLIQSQSTIFRSRPSFFEASVDVNCTEYKTVYLWEIVGESYCTNGGAHLSANRVHQEDAASPFLSLPKRSLEVGSYCLVFTVSFQQTPLVVQRKTTITVIHSPLVAIIKGGSHRLWSSLSDLVLDGSDSQDPDLEPGVEDMLQYDWACMMVNSTECPFLNQPSERIRVTLLSSQLPPGTIYVFTLTVHKKGRRSSSVNQTVTVTEAPSLPVSIQCISCSSAQHISYTTPIVLVGDCGQCDDQAQSQHTQYKWSTVDQSGQFLHLDEVTTSTGRHSPNLVVRSGVLQPGQSYSFTLDVSQPGRGRCGNAGLVIQPNNPPTGGQCDLSPESNIRLLETVVTYNCSGWRDDENSTSQLIYTFQVALCYPISTGCPVFTLYRGTRSRFGSLVPVGIPGKRKNTSVILVSLLVEDQLGAKVIALNRTLMLENPTRDEVAGEWLKIKSQTDLWALVQRGNPQEIVPYSIALISELNQQVELETTAKELVDRREIRKNVTKALTSLPVSSLTDVDQIASALSQSTAFPSELVCTRCQEKVLDTVGKMIHVLKQRTSPAVLPAVNVGRNILSVIGSTLSAISKSARSHPANSSTTWVAPGIALSALGHAVELMHALMGSHVHGEEPLSLSNDYINTVGFQGSPSELLCSNHSSQHHITSSKSLGGFTPCGQCQFDIPASLTAHLQGRRSEVVQVLFGTDGALESDALLRSADPPISTNLVAMELTTPLGQPIPIQDLNPEQAIRVTLPNRYPVEHRRDSGPGNETCLTVTVPADGRLNFTVKALDDLHENAGLYISFNFTLAPGAAAVSLGHVKIEVSFAVPGTNASQGSLVIERSLTLLAPTSSSEETIFLSPLLNGTDGPLSVNLTSSLVDGGPVHVSVCVFSSLCRFYSLKERRWSSDGLRPLEGSTLRAARCLTRHLTMFGASLFVHPGAVVLLPPQTGGPMRNILVGMVCAVLVLIHLLVGLIAHKLDHLDSLRLSQVPLCGRPGLYHYRVLVKTGWRPGAGTTAHVGISLYGVNRSGSRHLQRDGAFHRGGLDQFHVETDDNLGEVWKIRIWHDNTG